MKTIQAKKAAVAVARQKAERLAAVYDAVAELDGATEIHRLTAKTAQSYLMSAERIADVFPAGRHVEILVEIGDLEDQLAARINTATMTVLAAGGDVGASPIIQLATAAALAELNRYHASIRHELADHELRAWLDCCDRLSALRRPGTLVAGSTARH